MSDGVGHLNVARLRHGWDDPRSAGFVDAVGAINRLAERSAGFVWRLSDEAASEGRADTGGAFGDPRMIWSLSVWTCVDALRHFVTRTAHGAFLRRRSEWFAPMPGPTYVIWPTTLDARPSLAEAAERLDRLAAQGPSLAVFDFDHIPAKSTP